MATSEFAQGSVICRKGEPFRHLLIVMKGTVEASHNGKVFTFGQGDLLGLNALSEGSHSLTYTASSDVTIFNHPCTDASALEELLKEKADVSNIALSSMIRQISMFLDFHEHVKNEAVKAYELVTKVYPLYEKLCNLYAYTAKKLPALAAVSSPTENDKVARWTHDYYLEIKNLEQATQNAFFASLGIKLGFILNGAEEIVRILKASEQYQKYIENISKVMLNHSGFDLFSLISELHIASAGIKGADEGVEKIMSPLVSMLSTMSYVDINNFKQRVSSYKEGLTESRSGAKPASAASSTGEKQNLADSLSVILAYSGYPEEQANKFARTVQEYTQLPDRGGTEDTAHRLRREITNKFNEIYKNVFLNSLNDPAVPTIIKMFLNFGYMDAALAGYENADYLYSIADSICGDPSRGIYTVSEWLAAIYKGKKDPCRNEFDMDYPAYIADLKQQKRFDDKEEARLLADKMGKLVFEIENVFPIVNKLTFGRITTFCPAFSDNNVMRGLETSLITPDAITTTFDEIGKVDFAAFHREVMYSNIELGVPHETVNVRIMPEVILMPNVGARGIMWQEIEGRKRTTPGRMFLPLFLLTDLKPLLVRLTGEFRWEMCKRVQGSRWQDITEPSLTSEYSDYLQFYRTNRDLSTEIKASVKQELTRARNNYKAVFVSNYTEWVLFESNGSPRLNKFARKMMMTYCTFAVGIRDALAQNPQYAEPLKRFNFKIQQRENYLSRVIHKITQAGNRPPKELVEEMAFVKS